MMSLMLKFIEAEYGTVPARGWGKSGWEALVKEYEVSCTQDKCII